MVETISITLKGDSPILMHTYPLAGTPSDIKKWPPKKQAEFAAYRCPETKQLYIPGVAIQRCFIAGATYSKGKGRASLQKSAAACLIVRDERCLLGVTDFVVDSRAVVIKATGDRIVRHRPRLDEWSVSFELDYDPELLSASQVRTIIEDSGKRVGLLDFRPEKKGPFGRFGIVKFEE
jgi:hypothetical protein